MIRYGVLLSIVLLVAGCAGAVPEPSRYLLTLPEPPADALSAPDAARTPLYVAGVELAPFLSGTGIVYQIDAERVHAAAAHRWAEPLAVQLRRGLRQLLATRAVGYSVVPDRAGAMQLQVAVDSFHGRFDGTARVAGRWHLRAPDGAIRMRRNFRVEVPLREDGYPALVRALSEAWVRGATQIARSIDERAGDT